MSGILPIDDASPVTGDEHLVAKEDTKGLHTKSGTVSAFFNTAKMSVGIGMLSQPFAFLSAGYIPSAASLMFIAILSSATILTFIRKLNEAKQATQRENMSYVDTVGFFLGRRGEVAAALAMIVSMAGCNISYTIFLGNTFTSYLPAVSFGTWVIILQLPFVVMCWLRSVRFLCVPSALGTLSLCAGALLSAAVLFPEVPSNGWAEARPFAEEPHGYIVAFGISALGLEGLGAGAPSIANSMARPEAYPPILLVAVVIIIAINICFGLLGYVSYLDGTSDTITTNFPGTCLATCASISFCLELVFTYPSNMFPVWKYIDNLVLGPERPRSGTEYCQNMMKSTSLRTAVCIAKAAVAYLCRDIFAKFMAVVGCLACSTVLFLMPSIVAIKSAPYLSRTGLVSMLGIAVGTLAIGVGLYLAVAG